MASREESAGVTEEGERHASKATRRYLLMDLGK
jgi:hypothetical protein